MLLADIYRLSNPFDKPFTFKWDSRTFTVPANGYKLWPQPIAMHGARKIAEQLIRRNHGDMNVLNQDLITKYVNQVTGLYEATNQPQGDALEKRIAELNPDEEALTPEEEQEAAAEQAQVDADQGAFGDLNPEEVAEQERLEALKENNPKAYRAEILNQSTKKELLTLAEENEVEVDPKSNKDVIIEALVNAGV